MTEVDDEFTELYDATLPRVDLVSAPASGVPRWLIAKSADGSPSAGVLDPEFVRDLIAKAEPQSGRERVEMPNGVTLTGSPAAMAAFIHQASVRKAEGADVAKAKNDTADRKHKAATGAAMPDGSYPIASVSDLEKAIHAVGRGGSSHDAIRKHIISRARSLGASSKIPGNWNSDGSLKGDSVSKNGQVSKEVAIDDLDLDDGIDGMDPTVPLAAPDEDRPGDPTDPGSPAWESIDAATATKWTSILARARVAVDLLAEREMLEAASGDSDDAGKACDLADVCCAIDFAISVLAPFAVSEQSAADCGTAEMEAIGKAMAAFDSAPLATVEGFTAIAKSGRVLSAANEAHIREAAQALNTVLSSLPKAPQADDGQQVAKMTPDVEASMPEATPSEDAAAASGQQPAMGTREPAAQDAVVTKAAGNTPEPAGEPEAEPVAKSSPLPHIGLFSSDRRFLGLADPAAILTDVAKADGDGKKAMCVVYNQAGKLMGIVDPDDITPVANSEAEPDEAPDSDAAPEADASDMTPQPPAEAGTPADAAEDDGAVTKASQDSTEPDVFKVLKSTVKEAVAELLGAQAPQEDIAKAADVAGLTQEVELLKARLATVEEHPAAPKVFANGQVPPAHQMRGQDQGVPAQVDIAKAAELKREMYTADPARANEIRDTLNRSAIAALDVIHGRR